MTPSKKRQRAMRDYADDWADPLHAAPTQGARPALVQPIKLSDDEGPHNWLRAG